MVHIEPLIFSSFNALDVFPFHIYLLLLSIRPTTSRIVLWLLCTTAVCREKTFFCRECERREAACYTHSTTSCSIILLLLASRGNSPLFFSLLFNGKRHSRSIYVPDSAALCFKAFRLPQQDVSIKNTLRCAHFPLKKNFQCRIYFSLFHFAAVIFNERLTGISSDRCRSKLGEKGETRGCFVFFQAYKGAFGKTLAV